MFQCGHYGHNIRCRPDVKAPSVGRVKEGVVVKAVDQLTKGEEMWLKLHPGTAKGLVEGVPASREAWMLAKSSAGGVFMVSLA